MYVFSIFALLVFTAIVFWYLGKRGASCPHCGHSMPKEHLMHTPAPLPRPSAPVSPSLSGVQQPQTPKPFQQTPPAPSVHPASNVTQQTGGSPSHHQTTPPPPSSLGGNQGTPGVPAPHQGI